MKGTRKGLALALALGIAFVGILVSLALVPADAVADYTSASDDLLNEAFKFLKNIGIWFMLMMVAFLMLFIRKFEWGVCLAVLLSAASSYLVYVGIQQFFFDAEWNQDLMIQAVICAITYVIAIGVFLGTVKQWHYFLGGIAFAVVYVAVEWLVCNLSLFDTYTTDPGGSIMVHMCAAYFGLGVCLALRVKEAFNEPMYTTTHSVSFVWLASMVLWVLWPTFVCGLLPMEDFAWGTMTCYMAGLGSVVSAYVVCMVCQKKVNPLTYTYAMLAGPVAIGAPLLSVGPWGALLIGIVAGIVSALCFIYLQPRLCNKLGVLDVMGVHNLHGMAGWTGAIACAVVLLIAGDTAGAGANVVMAVIVFAVALAGGAITGIIIRLTKGKPMEMFSDDYDFIKSEKPEA
jgi:ammonium transporter Rh